MSSPLIWVLVAVVVVVVLAVLVAAYVRRRRTVYRDRAEELRRHALFQSEDIPAKEADARGARSAADEARHRAEELEAEARQKEAALERARARVEDTVREADRIDPQVRHKSGDYVPSLELDRDDTAEKGTDAGEAGATEDPDGTPVEHQDGTGTGAPADAPAFAPRAGADAPYEQPPPPGGPKHAAG